MQVYCVAFNINHTDPHSAFWEKNKEITEKYDYVLIAVILAEQIMGSSSLAKGLSFH